MKSIMRLSRSFTIALILNLFCTAKCNNLRVKDNESIQMPSEDSMLWGRSLTKRDLKTSNEDFSYWERELKGSGRRIARDMETNGEDETYWERELKGSSNRVRRSLERNDEDATFWERELKGSNGHVRRALKANNEDANFWAEDSASWERELGKSNRYF
mmetsp:Transcript_53056/g.78651  ORF Transcript_53056/g.78651 Transcript_53056/m.78651 type:complete len:159 (-) Transcript_53056:38-514(-)